MRGERPVGRLGQVLASYAAEAMPEGTDVWPLVSSKLRAQTQAAGEGVQAVTVHDMGARGPRPPRLLPQLARGWPLSVPAVAVLIAALVVAYVVYIGPEAGEPIDVASEAGAPAAEAQRPSGEFGEEPQAALGAAGGQQEPAALAQEEGGPQVVTDTAAPAEAATVSYPVPKGFGISVNYGHVGADAFVVTADGLERLVSSPSNDLEVNWSPDCSRIAFNSNRTTPSGDRFAGGNQNIWMMNADGTDAVQLTDSLPSGGSGRAQWSPDGTRIGFKRIVMEPSKTLTGPPWPAPKSEEIYVMNADGSRETRLTDGPGYKELTSWSPNGKRMLLNVVQEDAESGLYDEESYEIYVMNSDGTDMKNLSNRPGLDNHAKWSPDGKLIAFESTRGDGEGDIYLMDADGGNVRRLTDHPAADMQPHWSPDGKWISFTSYRNVMFPDEGTVVSRMAVLRDQAEARGISITEEQLRSMAEQTRRAGQSIPADIFVMKADGADVQHVIEGWGGAWSACMAQR